VTGYQPGLVRHLTVAGSPDLAAPYGLGIVGAGLNGNVANGQLNAQLDVVGMGMRNPMEAAGNKDLAVYLGYFGASYAYNPSANFAAVTASLVELIATWQFIAPYYDRNGQPGFQWAVGDPMFCIIGLSSVPSKDCIELTGVIEFKNKTWGTIAVSNSSCPSGYTSNCRVYSFNTSTLDGVFSLTLHLASEPVLVNNVRVEPSFGKIDISINYPWANLNVLVPSKTSLKLALYSSYAGKAGVAGALAATVDGKEGIVFAAAAKRAYFSWDGQAVVGGVNRQVYAQGISGQSILAYSCATCDVLEATIYTAYKAAIGVWAAFGWSTEFVLFSWDQTQPLTVVWDPKVGVETATTSIMYENSATAPAVTIVAVFAAVVALLQ